MQCGNATRAALEAGYSKKTADVIGHENLGKPEIRARLTYLRENLAESVGITPAMIATELGRVAFSNITNIYNGWMSLKDFEELPDTVRASIAEIQTDTKTTTKDEVIFTETRVKIKLHDKLKAIECLNKLLGFNAPEKRELTGKNGQPLLSPITELVVSFPDFADNG